MSPVTSPAKATTSPSILSQINEAKSQITRTQRLMLITGGVVTVTLVLGVVFIQLPWQEKRRQLSSSYSEEKERAELLQSIQRQRAELQGMEGKFLLEGGATGLASQLSQLAAQAGIQIESVTPQQEVTVEPYTRYQLEIVALSNLANTLRFLRAVEEHRPLLWVEQLDMGEPPEASVSFSSGDKTSLKTDDRQKIRLILGAVSRQKAS